LFKKDFVTALEWTEKASAIPRCQYWTVAHRAVAQAYLKQHEEAQRTTSKLLQQNPDFSLAFAEEKLFYLKKQEQIEL